MDTRHEPWPARMEIRCTASIMLTDLQIYFASEYGFKPPQRWLPLPGGLAAPRADTRDRGEGGGDFSEIKGQQGLRRAVEVAVAGPHNLLMLCAIPQGMPLLAISHFSSHQCAAFGGRRV